MEQTKKRRKNKWMPLVALLVVFLGILAAYLYLSAANDRREAEEAAAAQDETILLADLDASTATELRYRYRDGSDEWIVFTKSGDTWYAEDEHFPLNQDRVNAMVSAISSIGANRTVDEGTAEDYGLDEPIVSVEITYNGNTIYRYAIGNKNAFNGEYYFQNDDGGFYMIASGLLPYFQYTLDDLVVLDTPISDINTEYIQRIQVTLPTKETREFTAEDDIAALYELFCEFDCTRYAAYYADEETMAAEYGLDKTVGITIDYKKSVTVTDTSNSSETQTTLMDASYSLYIGSAAEDAATWYYTPQKSTIVYTIEDDIIESIWQMEPTVATVEADTEAEEQE